DLWRRGTVAGAGAATRGTPGLPSPALRRGWSKEQVSPSRSHVDRGSHPPLPGTSAGGSGREVLGARGWGARPERRRTDAARLLTSARSPLVDGRQATSVPSVPGPTCSSRTTT